MMDQSPLENVNTPPVNVHAQADLHDGMSELETRLRNLEIHSSISNVSGPFVPVNVLEAKIAKFRPAREMPLNRWSPLPL